MSSYPHLVKIYRKGAGSTSSEDVFTPGADQVVYDGRGDVQDEPAELLRDGDGAPTMEADALIFLESEASVRLVRAEDLVDVTHPEGDVTRGKVVRIRRLDATLYVRWIRNASGE